jgi:large repetitive protein
MFAASLLVVAVVATYASLAVISLTGAGTGSFSLSRLPGSVFNGLQSTVGWQAPEVKHLIKAKSPTTGRVAPLADITLFNFGSVPTVGANTRQLSISNPTSTVLPLHVTVVGPSGVTAQFHTTQQSTMNVHPGRAVAIDLTSDPMHAGQISGSLEISIVGSNAGPYSIALAGFQAPLASPSLTAKPVANGAINLAWTPSPSSGVSNYLVERSAGTAGAWQNVATYPGTATSAVDQTGTSGSFTYRVIAEARDAAAANGLIPGPAGPTATAVADDTAPAPISGGQIGSPQFINAADADSGVVHVPIDMPANTDPTDVVTVTLTDGTGATAVGRADAGTSTVNVPVQGVQGLADGKIAVSATVADTLGNTSPAASGPAIWKDTVKPLQPTVSVNGDITSANEDGYPVTVQTEAAAADGATVTATITDGEDNTASQQENEAPGATSIPINVNASKLDDGSELTVTATVKDEAGNVSPQSAPVPVVKDTTGPTAPTSFGIAAGPDNPAGVVTAQSASAVIVQATFAQPPDVTDTIRVWVNHQPYTLTPDGDSATLTIEPPLDLTGLPDGTYKIGMKQTDADGNETSTWSHFTVDTGGAEAPTGVGVPAGPDNPAGYVNAATQTAATIIATFAGPTDPADQISLTVGGMQLSTQSGGSDQVSWTADLSGLPDGTLPITGTIIDGNGVKSTFTGSLIKDTQAPPAPAVASVIGPPANTITPSSASCVKVFVAFNQAPDPNDAVTVTLSDGSSTAQGSATAGDGHVIVGCIDASSLSAGQISVNVTVTDAAGNSTDFTGTPAVLLACQHGGQGNGGSQSPDQ